MSNATSKKPLSKNDPKGNGPKGVRLSSDLASTIGSSEIKEEEKMVKSSEHCSERHPNPGKKTEKMVPTFEEAVGVGETSSMVGETSPMVEEAMGVVVRNLYGSELEAAKAALGMSTKEFDDFFKDAIKAIMAGGTLEIGNVVKPNKKGYFEKHQDQIEKSCSFLERNEQDYSIVEQPEAAYDLV